MKKVILVVTDSLGVGQMPDAMAPPLFPEAAQLDGASVGAPLPRAAADDGAIGYLKGDIYPV